jgi:hypothetical protein
MADKERDENEDNEKQSDLEESRVTKPVGKAKVETNVQALKRRAVGRVQKSDTGTSEGIGQ